MLPSDINNQPLSNNQKRNIFFNTFPKTWRADYRSLAHDIITATILHVKTYMTLKKLEIDKATKKKKDEKEQKEKSGRNAGRKGKSRGKGGQGGHGQGGRGSRPDSKCMKHPDGNHL